MLLFGKTEDGGAPQARFFLRLIPDGTTKRGAEAPTVLARGFYPIYVPSSERKEKKKGEGSRLELDLPQLAAIAWTGRKGREKSGRGNSRLLTGLARRSWKPDIVPAPWQAKGEREGGKTGGDLGAS